MDVNAGPRDIVWDITYACPLRCIHCYSESGRRPTRQLSHDDMLRVADALIALAPQGIVHSGGEPLTVKGVFDVVEHIARAGIPVIVYSSGWSLQPSMVPDLLRTVTRLSVSLDGSTPEVHDRIRSRAGSFDRAMEALHLLDASLGSSVAGGGPIGLGSRQGFVEHDLLSDAEVDRLTGSEQLQRLQALAPPSLEVSVTDNRLLAYRPELIAKGFVPAMQVEPDGAVRAMAIYEGTVGSLLTEPGDVLWRRSIERWNHPVVTEALASAGTMAGCAEATRRIDYHLGTDSDRARIDRRPPLATPAGA